MSFEDIRIGGKSPNLINVVIEIPKGSSNKYEYDETTHEIRLDRVLHSPMFYPADYGFIPQTRSDDGDHLDVLVLITQPTFPGCVLEARPVGVLDMEDENGIDHKILCVAEKDPRLSYVKTINGIDDHLKREITHFFEEYKALEDKWSKVKDWSDVSVAHEVIEEAHERYMAEQSQ